LIATDHLTLDYVCAVTDRLLQALHDKLSCCYESCANRLIMNRLMMN